MKKSLCLRIFYTAVSVSRLLKTQQDHLLINAETNLEDLFVLIFPDIGKIIRLPNLTSWSFSDRIIFKSTFRLCFKFSNGRISL